MSESTLDPIAERKTRERLEFLKLPRAEAQRRISLVALDPIVEATIFDQDLSYGPEEKDPV